MSIERGELEKGAPLIACDKNINFIFQEYLHQFQWSEAFAIIRWVTWWHWTNPLYFTTCCIHDLLNCWMEFLCAPLTRQPRHLAQIKILYHHIRLIGRLLASQNPRSQWLGWYEINLLQESLYKLFSSNLCAQLIEHTVAEHIYNFSFFFNFHSLILHWLTIAVFYQN